MMYCQDVHTFTFIIDRLAASSDATRRLILLPHSLLAQHLLNCAPVRPDRGMATHLHLYLQAQFNFHPLRSYFAAPSNIEKRPIWMLTFLA